MVSMNRLSAEKRRRVVSALVEGCSIRSTARMVGVSRNTIDKLLMDLGAACGMYQDQILRNLPCARLQCDEIWSFCHAKEKNVPAEKKGFLGYGDVWTWTAICAETKLVPCWLIGRRDADCAHIFMHDLAKRLSHRVQLTTDGHKPYLAAVESAFGGNIDYAMLVKLYGNEQNPSDTRYSPATCIGCKKRSISGLPDQSKVSTSFAERANLTMRMNMRRFTRLTNAFSKKLDRLAAAVNLHFMSYNFARIHGTLKSTPAMRAGVADHLWSIEEIIGLLEKSESNSN